MPDIIVIDHDVGMIFLREFFNPLQDVFVGGTLRQASVGLAIVRCNLDWMQVNLEPVSVAREINYEALPNFGLCEQPFLAAIASKTHHLSDPVA